MENIISWFEIPAVNLKRAISFYSKVLDIELTEGGFGEDEMAFFPSDMKNVSGAIVKGKNRTPKEDGTLIYFNGGEDLNIPLGRVEESGGKVIFPKTLIMPEAGYFAIFIDSEGNKVAIHSMK